MLLDKNMTVRLSDAAIATKLTPKIISNWLERGQVRLLGSIGREARKSYRFSFVDLIRVSAIGRLARFGIPVASASEIVAEALDNTLTDEEIKDVRFRWSARLANLSVVISCNDQREHKFLVFRDQKVTNKYLSEWRDIRLVLHFAYILAEILKYWSIAIHATVTARPVKKSGTRKSSMKQRGKR